MNSDLPDPSSPTGYDSLAGFSGEPGIFWGRLTEFARASLGAEAACLLVAGAGSGGGVRVLAQVPPGTAKRLAQAGLTEGLAPSLSHDFQSLPGLMGRRYQALTLPAREGLPALWLVVELPDEGGIPGRAPKVAAEVRALADVYQQRRHARRSEEKLLTLSGVMDLGLALGETDQFQEAAMRLCNELAAPVKASRVSLAWVEGDDLKLLATSHGGRISANAQETTALEQVMEEALDQDDEVSFPQAEGSSVVSREHRQFSAAHEGAAVLSVPLRHRHEAVGVICLERAAEDGAWTGAELERVRLVADLVAPRLDGLHAGTGWWGRRIWRTLRRRASGWLGVSHTGWKLAGVTAVLALLFMAVVRVEHKVKAPFILKTDAAALISAPFPGYIHEAHFHVGDSVRAGQVLVGLDRRELLLEEADTIALRNKSDREARGYEAEAKLAQMLVSRAEVQQADARLAIIRRRLDLTQVVAPFDGVIVEGDLRERLSSPVQTGEPLLKIVQVKDLFGQLQVDERDIAYLSSGRVGELAFASRPGEKYSVIVDRFEPVADVRPEGTVFVLRAQVEGETQTWWRPGMSGICKIGVGQRSLLWISGHRLVETLRLWLWV